MFQPTLPLRGATTCTWTCARMRVCFNPRSPCGERPVFWLASTIASTVSTHAPLAGSDQLVVPFQAVLGVSTHAPLAGSDLPTDVWGPDFFKFQPTLPLRGATAGRTHDANNTMWFQPTLPLRGATERRPGPRRAYACFNPRSPCGERLLRAEAQPVEVVVSTHAPLAGSDMSLDQFLKLATRFQPTLPLRGATQSQTHDSSHVRFQPTLPLRGATTHPSGSLFPMSGFNPRSPCGERLVAL